MAVLTCQWPKYVGDLVDLVVVILDREVYATTVAALLPALGRVIYLQP